MSPTQLLNQPAIFAQNIFMGKGDRKSRKGKIFMGSYGKTRPRKRKSSAPAASVPAADVETKAAKKKPATAKKKKEA